MRRTSDAVLVAVLLSLMGLMGGAGCKEERKPTTTGEKLRDLSFKRGLLYVLELSELKTDKLVGGEEASKEFKHFAARNQLLFYTLEDAVDVFIVGSTAPAASYGRSTYTRVRGRGDHLYVHLPTFKTKLIKDDGRTISMTVGSMRLKPDVEPGDDGKISGEFSAEIRGSFSVVRGDTRLSGEFFGTWHGTRDEKPPEITMIPPDKGLVSGAFDIYFDEPVTSNQAQNRVFLRNEANDTIKTKLSIEPTEMRDYSTHLRVETLELLPFNTHLILSVSPGNETAGFADLAGNRIERTRTLSFDTPDYPPLLSEAGHDFDAARTEVEFTLQRDANIIDGKYNGVVAPHSGRLLLIEPPPAGSRCSSALLARIRVPADATHIQVRVIKVADTREPPTPCLRFVVAQVNGMPHSVDCGPTDLPASKVETEAGDFYTTSWAPLTSDVRGQRGREVIIELEARPLDPAIPVESHPKYLVDMIRLVWEGQDPMVFD